MTLHNTVNVFNATSTLINDYILNFMLCACFNNEITQKTKKNSKKSELVPFCTVSTHSDQIRSDRSLSRVQLFVTP